jgi:cytochrome P450
MTLPRHVPAGGAVISGEWFPGGTRVGVNAAVVQRSQSIFGENPDDFEPERWLGAGAAKMERYMFQVGPFRISSREAADVILQFGAGSRTCIGKNVSY